MNSDTDIYSEFEPEANEIMFGQTTLPDRPLTHRELSKRKKIILKLLDQKLKFQLIELMAQQQQQMPTVNHDKNIDSNMDITTAASSTVPTNFDFTQNLNKFHPRSEYLQPPYENVWQPPNYQQHEVNASWHPHANNFQPNFESSHFNQNRNMKPSFQQDRVQPNNNLASPSIASSVNTQQKGITAVSKPKNITTDLLKNQKVASFTPMSSAPGVVSVNQLTSTSTSLQKSHPDSFIQFNNPTTKQETLPCKQPLSSEMAPFKKSIINSERQCNKHNPIDPNFVKSSSHEGIQSKNLPEPPSASLLKSNDLPHGRLQRRKRRRYNSLENSQIKGLLVQHEIADEGDSKLTSIYPKAMSSSSLEGIQSQNLLEPPSAPLIISNDSSHKRLRSRKRRYKRRKYNSSEDSQMKCMLIQQPTEAMQPNVDITDRSGSKLNAVKKDDNSTSIVTMPGKNSCINIDLDKTSNVSNTQCFRNISTGWKMLNQLVTAMCRNELDHLEPISPSQIKQNKQILIQVSINPNTIRSNSTVVQKASKENLEKFIDECKAILLNVSRAGPEIQYNFTESRNELIADLKALISKQDTPKLGLQSKAIEPKDKIADDSDSKLSSIDPKAVSSSSQEGIQSKNLLETSSAPLLISKRLRNRKRRYNRRKYNSSEDSQMKCMLIQKPTEAMQPNVVIIDENGSKFNAVEKYDNSASVVNMPGKNSSINIDVDKTSNVSNTQCFRNISTGWKMLNQLVTAMCRNELDHLEPISPSQIKQNMQILTQVSINPNTIRSNSIIVQKASKENLEKFIDECKAILLNVSLAGPEIQYNFTEARNELIADLKALISKQDTPKEGLKSKAIEPKDKIADDGDSKLSSIDPKAVSSSSQEGIQSKKLLEPPSAPLLISNDSSHKRLRSRKRRYKRRECHSSEDSQMKCMLTQQPTETMKPNVVITDENGSKFNAVEKGNSTSVVNMPGKNSSINIDVDKTSNVSNTQCFRNLSTEWQMLNQLVMAMCRNELDHLEPISPSQLKQNKQILIQVSINPNTIRSNSTVVQKASKENLEKFIDECKAILLNVSRAGPEIQYNFTASRNELIADLKALISKQDTPKEALKSISVENKIKTIINPFLCPEEKNRELVNKLMKNPYALEDQVLKAGIASKNQSVDDVMRQIKGVLDSCIKARQSKKLNLPLSYWIDVPFVVNLFNKSGKMIEEYAAELHGTLLDSINCLKIHPKPILRDITFNDGSLTIICINRMSFQWLENTISDHLSVNILPFKNVISRNELKTICMKFEVPQYYHFNNLMENLKVENSLLLTRRWELRSSQHKNVDSTKCVYVGVDVDSLIILEQMNRVGKLRGSSVYFEISYKVNEENFERMDFVEKKRKSRSRNRENKSIDA